MISPARTAALAALRAIETSQTDLPSAVAHSRGRLRDDRDRALLVEIVTGTVRWQRALDHLIEAFSRRALARIDADVVRILRLSLYQILHLDRVPAAAVVDDAVDLARAARKPSAAGFVNAVLRTTLRGRQRLPLPPRPADPRDRAAAIAYLGITHSHPDWYVARLFDRFGFDAAEAWVRFNNETPRLTVRCNQLRMDRDGLRAWLDSEGVETTPTRYAPHGLEVASGNPLRLPPDGSFVVQDEASQLVPLAVSARPGEHVLDVCASPGGKTTALAAAVRAEGRVVASDVRPRRVRLLRETVRASGAGNVRIVQVDAAAGLPFGPVFDRVLVDAPCSGLGTLRRDPDIRWKRTERDLPALAARQIDLLVRAAAVLKPGGRLVYATCSSEPEENEGVVEAFLDRQRDLAPVDLRTGGHPALQPLLDARGMFRSLPFAHGLEAFFAAALERVRI
jgi:16S rRNA (cytosine967-C5)-methyltransferase